MTAAMATMKASVRTVKTLADSETPQRFRPVMRASAARHSQTVAPYSEGKAAVSPAMPADTPTPAFST